MAEVNIDLHGVTDVSVSPSSRVEEPQESEGESTYSRTLVFTRRTGLEVLSIRVFGTRDGIKLGT